MLTTLTELRFQPPRAFLALVMALPEPDAEEDVIGRWADDGGFHPGEPQEDSE